MEIKVNIKIKIVSKDSDFDKVFEICHEDFSKEKLNINVDIKGLCVMIDPIIIS